jgi:hypothetical protein
MGQGTDSSEESATTDPHVALLKAYAHDHRHQISTDVRIHAAPRPVRWGRIHRSISSLTGQRSILCTRLAYHWR